MSTISRTNMFIIAREIGVSTPPSVGSGGIIAGRGSESYIQGKIGKAFRSALEPRAAVDGCRRGRKATGAGAAIAHITFHE